MVLVKNKNRPELVCLLTQISKLVLTTMTQSPKSQCGCSRSRPIFGFQKYLIHSRDDKDSSKVKTSISTDEAVKLLSLSPYQKIKVTALDQLRLVTALDQLRLVTALDQLRLVTALDQLRLVTALDQLRLVTALDQLRLVTALDQLRLVTALDQSYSLSEIITKKKKMTLLSTILCLVILIAVSLQTSWAICPDCDPGKSCDAMRIYALCLGTKTTANGCNIVEATAASTLKSATEATIRIGCTGCGLMASMAIVTVLSVVAFVGQKIH
ncbi:hypothetical protein Btru_020150 [Bulinus truncatus]|nr:hypothetical protein Btru_020150 [Bulinus truncatus]